jgi:tRNA (cmo5U34)-methyltransferase
MSADWTFHDFGFAFDTHVAAHLPGYADVQTLIRLIASMQVPRGGVVADLGCSTGTTAANIAGLDRDISFWLYDTDKSMLDLADERVPAEHTLCQQDVRDQLRHSHADLTVALWVMQFIPPTDWITVLANAHRASARTGCLLVAARTMHPDPRWESVGLAALDDYKANQGVTADERVAKTRSLRGVQGAWPVGAYREAIADAGWHEPTVLWRWHIWTVIGAWASRQPPDAA